MERSLGISAFLIVALWRTSCVTTEFPRVVIRNFIIPVEAAEEVLSVPSGCACKTSCNTVRCTTYSLSQLDGASLQCRLSTSPVRRYTWQAQDNAYVVHQSDYILRGQHFYQAKDKLSFNDANSTCFSEGGQLPVLLDTDTENEMKDMMAYFGVQKTYIGAFRDTETDANGNLIRSEPTVWTLANGTVIEAPELPHYMNRQCYVLDSESSETYSNKEYCTFKPLIICQRDY